MALQVGNKAPDFSTKDQGGNTVKLSALKGKKIVLYFYPKDMTPGCTAQACNLRDNYKLLQKQGYEVLGVSTDDEKSHQKFIAKEKLPFRLLADTDKSIHEAYGTWVEKNMYGRKYMGTARITFVIDEQGIITEIIEKVNTADHTAQILNTTPSPTKPAPPKAPATKKAIAPKKVTATKKAAPKKTVTKKAAKKTTKKK